jgi:hypothetical protein
MAKCYQCGSETELRISGVPVCSHCDRPESTIESSAKSKAEILLNLDEARVKYRAALAAEERARQLHKTLDSKNPDGRYALEDATRRRTFANERYVAALLDFDEFLSRGNPKAK